MRGLDNALFLVAVLTVAGSAVFAGIIYGDLPESVPSHFDFYGEADAYGSKSAIWMMPAIMGFLVVLLYVVALFNTNTTKGGKVLSDSGHRQIVDYMRRMLAILSLLMAIFAWEAVLIISGTMASPGIMLTLVAIVPIAVCIICTVRMYRVMKQDPGATGTEKGTAGPLLGA